MEGFSMSKHEQGQPTITDGTELEKRDHGASPKQSLQELLSSSKVSRPAPLDHPIYKLGFILGERRLRPLHPRAREELRSGPGFAGCVGEEAGDQGGECILPPTANSFFKVMPIRLD
jgi:hypothetical protein